MKTSYAFVASKNKEIWCLIYGCRSMLFTLGLSSGFLLSIVCIISTNCGL